jgi:hypothetical protein
MIASRNHFLGVAVLLWTLILMAVGAAAETAPSQGLMINPGRVEYLDGSEGHLLPDTLPFGPGEVLDFQIKYSKLSVGRARLELGEVKEHRGHRSMSILSRAKSAKWMDSVYKVRDEVESVMDLDRLHSLRFSKRLREGKYRADMTAEFLHEEGLARYEDGSEQELMPGSQDILTALLYIRSFPLEVGMRVHIPIHDGKKSYPLRVAVLARERVTTVLGEFECLVLEPSLESGGLFKSEGRMQIYLSDDERRLPVKLKAKAPVGAFTSELSAYRPGAALELSALSPSDAGIDGR